MSTPIVERLTQAGMSEAESLKKALLFATLDSHLANASRSQPLRWFVPGRIEVLGKHTDYAGGRSLLCTAERGFCVAAVPRQDSLVQIHDVVRNQSFEFTISPELAVPASSWRLYTAVLARRLARNFPGPHLGANIALASDLPSAAGMSSSSALLVAIFAVLSAANRLNQRPEYLADIHTAEDLAGYLGCIENGQSYKSLAGDGGVGTFGGSEDHTAILASEPGRLKRYSFCPVRLEATVDLPPDCTFVIAVSGVVADKTGTAKASYNRASQAVRSILEVWSSVTGSNPASVAAAANSSPDAPVRLRAALRESKAPDTGWLLHRFDHFWRESEVILPQAFDALARGDLHRFGGLVDESQSAAASLLGNQVPEIIWLARKARELGALAASAFGAGFGGSAWALVYRNDAPDFMAHWRDAYECSEFSAAGASQFFVTSAGPPMTPL